MNKDYKTSLTHISQTRENEQEYSLDISERSKEDKLSLEFDSISLTEESQSEDIAKLREQENPRLFKINHEMEKFIEKLKLKNFKASGKIDKAVYMKGTDFDLYSEMFRQNAMKMKRRKREEEDDIVFDCYDLIQQRILTEEYCYLIYKEKSRLEKLEFEKKKNEKKSCLKKFWIKVKLFFAYLQMGIYVLVSSMGFEYMTLFVIMANTVYLAVDEETRESLSSNFDLYFLLLYCLEMFLKIFAYGFILNPGSYMRNSWNVFDFFIIILSTFTVFFSNRNEESTTSFNISSLRSIRVLRPLRTITKLKRLKQIVSTILSSLPNLIEILLVLLVFLSVMAITGVQLFMGALTRRCVDDETGFVGAPCGNRDCPVGSQCLDGQENPNYGVTNFDNFLSGLLMTFQIITLEGWSEIMLFLEQGYSNWVFPYFMILIFMGSIFLLNMMLAVILVKYSESQKRETKHERKKYVGVSLVKYFDKSLYLNISRKLKLELSEVKNIEMSKAYASKKGKNGKSGVLNKKKDKEGKGEEEDSQLKLYARRFLNKVAASAGKIRSIFVKPRAENQTSLTNFYFNTESSESNLRTEQSHEHIPDFKSNLEVSEFIRSIKNSEKIQKIHSPRRIKPRRSGSLKNKGQTIKKSSFQGFDIFPIKEERHEDGTPNVMSRRARLKSKEGSKKKGSNKKSIGKDNPIPSFSIPDFKGRKRRSSVFVISDDEDGRDRVKLSYKEDGLAYNNFGDNLEKTVVARKKKGGKKSKRSRKRSGEGKPKRNNFLKSGFKDIDFFPTKLVKEEEEKKSKPVEYNPFFKPKSPNYIVPKKGRKIKKFAGSKRALNSKIISFFELEEAKSENNSQLDTLSFNNSSNKSKKFDEFSNSLSTLGVTRMNSSAHKLSSRSNLKPKKNNFKKAKTKLTQENLLNATIKRMTKRKIFEIRKKKLRDIKKEIDWDYSYKPSSIFDSTKDVFPSIRILEEKIAEDRKTKKFEPKNLGIEFKKTKYKKKIKGRKKFVDVYKKILSESVGFPISDENIRTYFVFKSHHMHYHDQNIIKDNFNFTDGPGKLSMLKKTKFNVFGSSKMLNNKSSILKPKFELPDSEVKLPIREIPLGRTYKYKRDLERMKEPIKYDTRLKFRRRRATVFHKRTIIEELDLKKQAVDFNFESLSKIFNEEDINIIKEKMRKSKQEEVTTKTEDEKFYEYIKGLDYNKRKILSLNWSGPQVLKYSGFLKNQDSILKTLNDRNTNIWERKWSKRFRRTRFKLKMMVLSENFQRLIIVMVLLNTTFLALDNLVPSNMISLLRYISMFFTVFFFMEMVIKLLAFGVKGYMRDFVNIFDGLVSILGVFELMYISIKQIDINSPLSALRSLRLFRALRVFRMTRVIRSLKYMKVILEVLIKSIDQFFYIAMILLLFIVIFSLLGMEIYGDSFEIVDKNTRISFSSFKLAFLSVFQIMTMENWQEFLFLTFRAEDISVPIALSYLIIWIFIGNYIFLNLFLAILLDGFTDPNAYVVIKEINNEEEELDFLLKGFKTIEEQKRQEEEKERIRRENFQWVSDQERMNKKLNLSTRDLYITKIPEDLLRRRKTKSLRNLGFSKKKNFWISENPYKGVCCTYSMLVFDKNNRLRLLCSYIASSGAFDVFIIFVIIISSFMLILSSYLDLTTEGPIKTTFETTDLVISVIFFLECFIKIMRNGFALPENSYIRDPWNKLDFFIVVSSLINFVTPSTNDYTFLRVLRILKTLRPLRFISHNKSMRLIVNALVGSLGAIVNVLIVISMIWVMWSIVGINLLSNKLGYCSDPQFEDPRVIYGVNKSSCAEQGFEWKIHDFNFENIYESLATLFVISTLEGWPNIMQMAMDGNYEDEGPQKNSNFAICWFFISFVLIGGLILVNLFIGVIGFRFSEEQEKVLQAENVKNLDPKLREWVYLLKAVKDVKPQFYIDKIPKNKCLKFLYKMIKSRCFEASILFCIFLNIVSLGFHYYNQPQTYENVLVTINLIFTVIFILEAAVKIVVLRTNYFIDTWDRFDFVIVLMSIVDLVLFYVIQGNSSFLRVGPQIIRVLRIFRISRLFKLLKSKKLEGFKKILRTLKYAFSSFTSLFALLLIIYFVYSIMGVFLFGNLETEMKESDSFRNAWVNFDTFGWSLLTMFRCSTGEDWHVFMSRYAQDSHSTPFITYLFFMSFELISSFILLNLLVLVVINQFEVFYFNKNYTEEILQESCDVFNQIWNKFTVETKGEFIHESRLVPFMTNLPHPLGYRTKEIKEVRLVNGDPKPKYKLASSLQKISKDVFMMDMFVYFSNDFGLISHKMVFLHTMKKAFGRFRLSKSKEEEVKLIKKIELDVLTYIIEKNNSNSRIKKLVRKYPRIRNLSRKKNQTFANPLYRMLFSKMVYKVWVRYTREIMKKEALQVKRKIRRIKNSVVYRQERRSRKLSLGLQTKSMDNSPEKEKLKLQVENYKRIETLIHKASISEFGSNHDDDGNFKISVYEDE